jgi:hypothetical protein
MQCKTCGAGFAEGAILLRQNDKGLTGEWACVLHNAVEQDPAVMETVALLSEVLGDGPRDGLDVWSRSVA